MIVTIIAIVLGIIMTIGGVAPNIANGLLQDRLNETLNQPEYLRVQVHPAAPSFSMLGGTVAYTEIDAERFVISELPVEKLQIRVDRLDVNTDDMALREPTQGTVHIRITEAGLNQFLKSDTFRELLDNIKQRQELASQIDADIQELNIDLQTDKVNISGQASTMGGFFTLPFELSGQLRLNTERQLYVQNVSATTLGRPLAPDMIIAILESLNPILDLEKLSDSNMQFYFRQLKVNEDSIELLGEAQLKKLPG